MKKPSKKSKADINTAVAAAVLLSSGEKKQKGEDLIADPKLKKAYREAMKRAAKKP